VFSPLSQLRKLCSLRTLRALRGIETSIGVDRHRLLLLFIIDIERNVRLQMCGKELAFCCRG